MRIQHQLQYVTGSPKIQERLRRKAKRHHILKKRQTRSFAKIDGLSTLHIPAVQNGYLDVIIHRIECNVVYS
uniref:Uncharacterized protein n=1 Tax=Romanomermis culicivorax TaxID=13658 RepID=A0A915IQP5_ROMCU